MAAVSQTTHRSAVCKREAQRIQNKGSFKVNTDIVLTALCCDSSASGKIILLFAERASCGASLGGGMTTVCFGVTGRRV